MTVTVSTTRTNTGGGGGGGSGVGSVVTLLDANINDPSVQSGECGIGNSTTIMNDSGIYGSSQYTDGSSGRQFGVTGAGLVFRQGTTGAINTTAAILLPSPSRNTARAQLDCDLLVKIYYDDVADVRMWLGWFENGSGSFQNDYMDDDDPLLIYVAATFSTGRDTNWQAAKNHDGGVASQVLASLGFAPAINTPYYFRLRTRSGLHSIEVLDINLAQLGIVTFTSDLLPGAQNLYAAFGIEAKAAVLKQQFTERVFGSIKTA